MTVQASWPTNTWYVAFSSDEVTDKPQGRQICGKRMVFYRTQNEKIAALADFCPHRGAPLSLGYVNDEGDLVCGYHGMVMNCDGNCKSMPGQRVNAFPGITAYPVEERYGFIWVWPGDPEKADTDLIPKFDFFDDPDWAYGGGVYHINCNYKLMVDNLMDLTHETYVHATSIGQPEIEDEAPDSFKDGDTVVTKRTMESIKAPPFWQNALRFNDLEPTADVDRWQISRFTPPSHIMINVGVAIAGKGGFDAPADQKASSVVVDFITPETETSIWYYWGMARNFKPNDQELTDKIREGQGQIFSEDLEMLEAQQRNLIDNPDRQLLKLNIDGGGVLARRMIDKILKQEASAS